MSIDVKPEVIINKPRGEVAAFMFDPANDLAWTGGITASRPAQPGPLVTGAVVERTAFVDEANDATGGVFSHRRIELLARPAGAIDQHALSHGRVPTAVRGIEYQIGDRNAGGNQA